LKRTVPLSLLALAALAFVSTTVHAEISYAPVTAGATGGAQKLYNFLATNYGVKTISGMMTGDMGSGTDAKKQVDVDSMFLRTGKYPALVGYDFLFATGKKASDAWYQSYTTTSLAQAKDLWGKGGIPAFTWHWKDPSDSLDEFYSKSVTFDFTKGFKTGTTTWDSTSTTFKQMVADIDEIAVHFLALQKDSVAAIFRPIHEASGKWFWWGTKGGPAFQALYNLIYDRMVKDNGVKNLVWVWNPQYATDETWNPGATKYDVISLDIYEAYDYTTKFVAGHKALTANFGTDKILAMSENGPIPDVSTMKKNGTVWSWWMPWYQSWSGKFLDQTMDAVWKANMEDPCTITLDEMPGWGSYTLSSTKVSGCAVGYELGDLDTARPVVEKVPGDTATNGWLRAEFEAASGDTAKGNVVISGTTVPNLSTAKTLTLNVVNGNSMTGFWFTIAFLGNANTAWGWAQPDGATNSGCWVNPGDSAKCTIDLTSLTKEKVKLTGTAYTTFMSSLAKIYVQFYGENFAGSAFFDNVVVDGKTVINNFDKAQTFTVESDKNLVTAEIIGRGTTSGIRSGGKTSATRIAVQGKTLQLTLAESGNAAVDLFDLQGSRIAVLHNGHLAAGSHALSLKNLHTGLYVVRVKGSHGSDFQKVIVK
jgi:hypothetical protein